MIQLYWDIGSLIVRRQHTEGWGAGVIDRLAGDLQKAFPGLQGFSASNISRMRALFLAYASDSANSAQPVPKLKARKSAQAVPKTATITLPPSHRRHPLGHNVVLLFQLTNAAERLWYAQRTTRNGWSRSMLEHWIESDLYARQGKAVTNFKDALPPLQSDLANEIVRDPYNFDFLTLRDQAAYSWMTREVLSPINPLELSAPFSSQHASRHLDEESSF